MTELQDYLRAQKDAGFIWAQQVELDAAKQRIAELESKLHTAQHENHKLSEMLRPGSPTERAPTQDAYDAACAALHKHRERADTAHHVGFLECQRQAAEKIATAKFKPAEDDLERHLNGLVDGLIQAISQLKPEGE